MTLNYKNLKASLIMPNANEDLAEIKSRQNVLITRAGLNIASNEMSQEQIYEQMSAQFKCAVDAVKLPKGMAKNTFYRTTRHLDDHVDDKDLHTGATLWRKFSTIKRYVNNIITPIYVKFLGPDGKPPSGHTKEMVLMKTKEAIYDQEQMAAKNRSKNPENFKIKAFKPSNVPCEWEVFMKYGRGSEKAESAFFIE